ncbi:MAG: Ig domain-containing protein group 2 domain-containing protein, partial [bacterium]
LDLANLPPNRFWRVIWNTPGGFGRYYVRVINCAVGGLSADYGHFSDTGSLQDGPADHFELNDQGEVCVWIRGIKVGSPSPGQNLTAVNADCREVVGNCPGGPGGFAPLDVTNSGTYLIKGNATCAPVPVELAVELAAVSINSGIELSWSSFAVAELTGFHIYRGTSPDAPERLTSEPIRMGSGGAFTWHDNSDGSADIMYYRLTGLGRDGTEQNLGTTSVSVGGHTVALRLLGANPIRNKAVFEYALPAPGPVLLEVYSVNGARVTTLVNRTEGAGLHTVNFDLRADDGRTLGTGVYLIRLVAAGATRSLKVVTVN